MPRRPHNSRQSIQLFSCLLEQSDKWHYGYALIHQTGLKSGTLYPLLIRLADDGLLDARWQADPDNGKPRREYKLTASGISLAHERLAEFRAKSIAGNAAKSNAGNAVKGQSS